ncbi:hypothetical protein L1987_50555 [Smallanthus sonchifolius]|uniref:Uncharacterized protein n=1 Tax=Smallanthus sonchifolius TaxID=185202 RepID=A0ACB9EMD2_9ASTR|nr:hypothetical protein L1987_50555 [Smallanthus sonchifolius]
MNSAGASSPFDSFKSKKVLRSSVNKPHLSGEAPDQSPWSSKTPEKPTNPPRRPVTRRQSLRSVNQVREAAKHLRKPDLKPSISTDPLKSAAAATETLISKPNTSRSLPEKYEMLNTFFDRLGSSIRLLRLKGSMSTFTNISRQVEILTDRNFAYSHLAQLKFLLPEALEIKKILVRDDRTSCMKPDLHVTLNFSIVQDDEKLTSDSAFLLLSKLFRSRLLSFCKSNPEGDEVPEDELPEPFNRSKSSSYSVAIQKANQDSVHDITSPIIEQQPIAASLMPQSFKRRFSKQVLSQNVDHESACVSNVLSLVKLSSKLPETPIKGVMTIDGTPVKLVSTPLSATPAQSTRPPVRGFMTPDEDPVMSPSKLTRRASGKRSITFDTPLKSKTPPIKRVSTDDDDLFDILSDDLLASIKEKELKTLHEKNPEISQAKWRKQMIAGLPKLFDTLLFYFQSVKRTVITKEELMKMITLSQLEIVDRREADEQVRLLQELAPEWIYEKTASSGDLLICVNKISSPESIRARLSEAN